MNHLVINLRDIAILIADPNTYLRRLTHGMLQAFGANKISGAGNAMDVIETLLREKVDILLCDMWLPPHGGLALIRAIRQKVDNPHRTIPILAITSDLREVKIKQARDAGANMVIAKPMSPKALYDRLAWIAFTPRQFVDCPTYFGPDRRFKIEGYPGGVGRRKGDKTVELAGEVGPTLGQDDIDSLFNAARAEQPK